MTVFFTERRLQGELMDDPALDETEHVGALRGLARINAVSRTAAALWPTVVRVAAAQPGRCLTLLDVACGGGDVALALAARARRSKLALDVNGCDVSPIALRYAAGRAAEKALPVRFFRFDALADPIAAHYDIVVTTLFLHHLADEEIVALLTRLARHTDHLLVSDLLRGPLGYGLAWAGTRLLSTSPIVHVDGLRSVRAALSLSEVRRLIVEAGLADARITHSWPRRFLFYWTRPKTAPE
ncbi:MAG: methyltransferase domain-containing protein, partial [Gammaproteobacteria bacterium]